MARLTMAKRKGMPKRDFAGGGPKGSKGFPMNDPTHARLAISGATRSYNAGNISKGKEESIKAEARHKLGDKDGDRSPSHPASHDAFLKMDHGDRFDHMKGRGK